MIELTILGSAATYPSKYRNVSGYFVKVEGDTFLLDAGEGVQRGLMKYASNFEVDFILVSHKHGDHWWGLIPYMVTMDLLSRKKMLKVYLPKDLIYFEAMLKLQKIQIDYPYEIIYYDESNTLDFDKYRVEFFKTDHTNYTYGVKFNVKERFALCKDKIGIIKNKGNLSTLQRGIAIIQDEVIISPYDVCESHIPSFSVIYGADSTPLGGLILEGCALLVHEGTFGPGEEKIAKIKKHSCIQDVFCISESVNQLCISHIGAKLDTRQKLKPNIDFAFDGLTYLVSNKGIVSKVK